MSGVFELATKGDVEGLRARLLKFPAEVQYRDAMKTTPLHMAALHVDATCVKLLLEEAGADPNLANVTGAGPLLFAVGRKQSCIACVRALVEQGKADVNMLDKGNGTALMKAVSGEQLEEVVYLLEHKANVHQRDLDGLSALSRAIKLGGEKFQFAKALLGAGSVLEDHRGEVPYWVKKLAGRAI
jgi:ankyrin repeat protein